MSRYTNSPMGIFDDFEGMDSEPKQGKKVEIHETFLRDIRRVLSTAIWATEACHDSPKSLQSHMNEGLPHLKEALEHVKSALGEGK